MRRRLRRILIDSGILLSDDQQQQPLHQLVVASIVTVRRVEHLGDLAFPGALAAGGIQVMDPLPADDARIADLTLETPWYS
ncbi:MAG: hypothetical protein ACKO3F_15480 [Cyanobium sp.]